MKRTHRQFREHPISAARKGTRRWAMTSAELIVVLFVSSMVALATFTLVNAYINNAMSDDLGEIRAESSLLYAYVQGWLQDARIIAAAYGPDYDGDIAGFADPPVMDTSEVAIGLIAADMGPREHNGVADNELQYDEVEALVWTLEASYTEGGANGSGGMLMRLYYADDNAFKGNAFWPDPTDGVGDPGALCVPDHWLTNADSEFLSDSVVRMEWLPPSTGNCDPETYLDVRFTLMDFSRVGPGGMPQRHSFQLVANTQGAGL